MFYTRFPDISWRLGRNRQMFCGQVSFGKSCIHTAHPVLLPLRDINMAEFWGRERNLTRDWPFLQISELQYSSVAISISSDTCTFTNGHKVYWVAGKNEGGLYLFCVYSGWIVHQSWPSTVLDSVPSDATASVVTWPIYLWFPCSIFQVTPSLSPLIPVALSKSILAFVPICTNIKGVNILKQNIIITYIILAEWVHRACSE